VRCHRLHIEIESIHTIDDPPLISESRRAMPMPGPPQHLVVESSDEAQPRRARKHNESIARRTCPRTADPIAPANWPSPPATPCMTRRILRSPFGSTPSSSQLTIGSRRHSQPIPRSPSTFAPCGSSANLNVLERKSPTKRRAGHPAWRRCSSLGGEPARRYSDRREQGKFDDLLDAGVEDSCAWSDDVHL